MTIQLGSVLLRDGMVWEDEFLYTGIVQEVKTTLGGVPQVFSAPVIGPKRITLVSLVDQGWQTYESLKALQLMSQTLGGQFPLTFGTKTFIVGFRHNESSVLEATPLIPRTAYNDEDFFQISLKLTTFF